MRPGNIRNASTKNRTLTFRSGFSASDCAHEFKSLTETVVSVFNLKSVWAGKRRTGGGGGVI